MNEVEIQILSNQYAIMSYFLNYAQKENLLRKQINNTFELLNENKELEDKSSEERDELLKEKVHNSEGEK